MLIESIIFALIFSSCFADFDETLIYCKTPPPKLIYGLIKRDRVSYYNGKGYLGSMEFRCLSGFDLLGNRTVTCQNGIWSPMTQCIPKKRCSPIKTYPLNAVIEWDNITFFQNDPQQIIAGATVTLRCVENYEWNSTSSGSLSIRCQDDGSWTPMPSCRYARTLCDYSKLYLSSRSRITRMNFKFSETNRQLHMVGSNLEYTCEEGYRLHDGQTSLTVECLNSGSWSPLPICEFVYETKQPIRCNYPVYIQNGFITVYNVTIWEDRTYTGRIVYECNYGFETSHGHDQILSECLNGTWTNVMDCQEIPTCLKQDLLDFESQAENSYVYNVSLQYIRDPLAFVYNSYVLRVCLPNFEHDPASPPLKIQCQRDTKTWTGIPICRGIKAVPTQMRISGEEEQLVQSDNLILLPSDVKDSPSQTTIEIESSTVVSDTTHTITCNSNDIPFVPNSIMSEPQLNVTYNVGTVLFYICPNGHESSSNQSSFTTCLMNATWSIDTINIIMCQLKNATTKEVFVVTSTIQSNTTQENDTINEILPSLNSSNETFSSSMRSMSAADRQVRHITSHCKELPQIEHAQLLSDNTIKSHANHEINYSGSLLFVCQFGFMSDTTDNEPFRLTCQNGVFHPKIHCIEKPRCSLPPPIDLSRSSIMNSLINVFDTSTNEALPGSFILLNCLNKTNNENAIFNMTCEEAGQWLSPPSSCMTPFKRRCQSGITIPNARTQIYAKLTTDGYYDDGSRVTYQCLENFLYDRQSGPLHIQCKNGRWGPRPRCIPNGCLEPLPDTIANGWKSAESHIIYNNDKYYLLTRYSCHPNAVMVDSSSRVMNIECRNNKWQYETLPVCRIEE